MVSYSAVLSPIYDHILGELIVRWPWTGRGVMLWRHGITTILMFLGIGAAGAEEQAAKTPLRVQTITQGLADRHQPKGQMPGTETQPDVGGVATRSYGSRQQRNGSYN
jgi:hypothetical protein